MDDGSRRSRFSRLFWQRLMNYFGHLAALFALDVTELVCLHLLTHSPSVLLPSYPLSSEISFLPCQYLSGIRRFMPDNSIVTLHHPTYN
jgi:hypothetical protein